MKKNKRNGIKHILAMLLFCMVMSMGMVSLADVQGTVIAKSAVIRASADPNSEKLASVPSGKVIDIIGKASGTDGHDWYQVYVNASTKGFIRSDLIKVPDGAKLTTVSSGTTSAAQSNDAPPASVNPVEARQVTVISNNTNIRESASTTSASKAKANRGMVLTVTGEAVGSDNKTWYQVSFTYNNNEITGFIRSDLVTGDNVPADAATAQITGTENPGEEQPAEMPPEEQAPEPPAETNQPSDDVITPMNVDSEPPYVMAEFKPLKFKLPGNDEEYNGYSNGNFLICYARKSDGEEGWYLIDREQGVWQRYAYTADGVTVPKGGIGSVGLVPVIVLIVIVIILVAAVGMLLMKLRGEGTSYKRYKGYDDDDDDDDDIEDLEDMEDDDEEEPQPVRRPQGPQSARRPQGGAPGNAPQGQLPRRPQGQQPPRYQQSQQPPRRPPQGKPSNGNAPQGGTGGQPPRRPQGGNPSNNGARPQNQQPPRRPQGQPPRRPQNEKVPNEKGQAQKGYKSKDLMDDDIDLMDIE